MSKSRTDVPEQTHEAMQAAAMRPVSGPAATTVLAAGGGLELPGRERNESARPIVGIDQGRPHEPIPGERDATTAMHRQPGAMTGAFNGADNVQDDPDAVMDSQTARERLREGGGRDGERLVEENRQGER